MHRMTGSTNGTRNSSVDGWSVAIVGTNAARERWAETVTALANGTLGIRGVLDERAAHGATTLLSTVFETSPIHYHERHRGFAGSTDTRVPVADAATIAITVDGTRIAAADDVPLACERRLDLRTGRSSRRTVWRSPAGPIVVTVERIVPAGGAIALTRYAVAPASGRARIVVTSGLHAPPLASEQGHDPRIGTANLRPLDVVSIDPATSTLVQRTHRSGIVVAAACAHYPVPALPVADAEGLAQTYAATAAPDAPLSFVKAVAYADTAVTAHRAATAACEAAAFDRPSDDLAGFWADAEIAIDGDPDAERALRFNMFHVFQSCPRDGRVGLAAKGLTGEGYEGHSFWDGEVFVLPMLAVTAPALARAMLDYRYATLDAARDNARALDHARGALFAWRTIAGHEASAHYPSGSAQYHINADVAFAIGLYDAATGDTGFLIEKGGEMLAETARIWMQVGHFAGDGAFHIFGVTGPD
jgi:alpha,alpha-trehalose phosphorylase